MYREIKEKNNSRHASFEINQHLTIKYTYFGPSPIADDIVIQWNLSIADLLYSGHLSIADTFPKNG